MSAFENRSNTALLVIDVQNGVVERAHLRNEVVGAIAGLVFEARGRGIPVVWVQHSDDGLVANTYAWEYVPELAISADEVVIHKHYGDSFEGTNLDNELDRLKVGRLIVCGAQTDVCIRCTLHGALARGYDTVLVGDAHTTDDADYLEPRVRAEQMIAHTNHYWHWMSTPSAHGDVVKSDDVVWQLEV